MNKTKKASNRKPINNVIRFTESGKQWFVERVRGRITDMVAVIIPSTGLKIEDAESGKCEFEYYGNHYTIGWNLISECEATSIKTIFGHKVSVMDEVIEELKYKCLDIITVVDLNTGRDQDLLHAIAVV